MVQRYRKGRRKEYEVMKILRNEGFMCCRTAGSHSPWDIIAYNDKMVRWIQVKSKGPVNKLYDKLISHRIPKAFQKEIWVLQDRKEPEIFIC